MYTTDGSLTGPGPIHAPTPLGIIQLSFSEASQNLSDNLVDDGSVVGNCDHGGGHSVPSEMDQILNDWLFAHHFEEDSPFADGLDSAFPSYCSIAN